MADDPQVAQPAGGAAEPPQPRAALTAVRGYYALANQMTIADNDLAIFRNFKSLNVLCLLQLQAEITILEDDLTRLRDKDDKSENHDVVEVPFPESGPGDETSRNGVEKISFVSYQRNQFTGCFKDMQRVAAYDPEMCLQFERLGEIRKKLQEYNEMLLQFSKICELKKPDSLGLLDLKEWVFNHQRAGTTERRCFLKPPEIKTFITSNVDDYVLIQKPDPEKDIVPHFILSLYHRIFKKRLELLKPVTDDDGQTHYARSKLIIVGNWVAPILSSVLLIAATLVLNAIHTTTQTKLFAMIPLTVFFAFVVKAFTSASRAEIFVAVAGFVAVEVVFVGSVPGS
ncbi:hypothetical protein B0T19DRAFT_457580 [Cercophora scortea]|uniref:DUF6594 domain-containing protein n=1 Tax=Cercophora scortea TaxID=314031 RepID=A0AAE0IY53_9PEZI|nr:hypothetical protein B0T19DRAFT_457580 [Cercophora scortea]